MFLDVSFSIIQKKAVTHIWNDDSELRVECMVHLANCSFITPEGVVVLAVLGVRVSDRREQLVPRRGVGVRLRHAVRRLPAKPNTQSVDWFCWNLPDIAVTAENTFYEPVFF